MDPPVTSFQVFSIGHSNRTLEDLLSLLKEFHIQAVADIRRFPSSRKFPHFNHDFFGKQLQAYGIHYVWFERLGGFRRLATKEESPNIGLESPGFRNYADHMMTQEFRETAGQLMSLARSQLTAILCAEKVYWKCHRLLLSDFLTAHGVDVKHIIDHGQLRPHKLSSKAVVQENGTLVYP